MTTVLCHFRVADYDAWRRGYDHVLKVTPGVHSFRAWRAQDDPSLVMVEETFDTLSTRASRRRRHGGRPRRSRQWKQMASTVLRVG